MASKYIHKKKYNSVDKAFNPKVEDLKLSNLFIYLYLLTNKVVCVLMHVTEEHYGE